MLAEPTLLAFGRAGQVSRTEWVLSNEARPMRQANVLRMVPSVGGEVPVLSLGGALATSNPHTNHTALDVTIGCGRFSSEFGKSLVESAVAPKVDTHGTPNKVKRREFA